MAKPQRYSCRAFYRCHHGSLRAAIPDSPELPIATPAIGPSVVQPLHNQPNREYYDKHKEDFKNYLEKPVKELFENVADKFTLTCPPKTDPDFKLDLCVKVKILPGRSLSRKKIIKQLLS